MPHQFEIEILIPHHAAMGAEEIYKLLDWFYDKSREDEFGALPFYYMKRKKKKNLFVIIEN